MAFSQDDLNAIAAAQSSHPNLGIPLLGVATLETGGQSNPDTAISSTGATGLFQILPSTAQNPGYGVTGITPSQLDDPVSSANFAANYLQGLEAAGDTPQQAITAYSHGGYSLAQVDAAAGQIPVGRGGAQANAYQQGLQGNPNQQVGGGLVGGLTGLGAFIGEIVERGAVVLVGVALLIVGLIFLLKDSSTTTVPISALRTVAE